MVMKYVKAVVEIGIVSDNVDAMLKFYRDTLGLTYQGHLSYPGGSQHRLSWGDAILKIVTNAEPSPTASPPGGPHAGVHGYRYISFSVTNLREVVAEARAAGHRIPVDVTVFSPELGFAYVADPDGNWIELYGPTA